MTGALLGVMLAGMVVNARPARTPVLVELFSSEGCSSCPPADALLRTLDLSQPIPGAEVVALELHVDYWNRLGWTDPFSSHAFTERQSWYAGGFGRSDVYTPQMVVDGTSELVGSDSHGAREAITDAAKRPKRPIQLDRKGDALRISVPALTADAEIWLAITERGLSTEVLGGENAGKTLVHGPVVRGLQRIGTAGPKGLETTVKLERHATPRDRRAVVFAQDPHTRAILALGTASLDENPAVMPTNASADRG